jgi:hypothetical protein
MAREARRADANEGISMKITYSKSEPWKSGWRGWSDFVDVLVDGEKIGQLVAQGDDQKRYLNYNFQSEHPAAAKYPRIGVIGLRAAKQAVSKALAGLQLSPWRPLDNIRKVSEYKP